MPKPVLITFRDQIAWSYANLARAHAALTAGRIKYSTVDHMIRAKLFKGLRNGSMAIGSIYDDERMKFLAERSCVYCGSSSRLSVDHLFARMVGGSDDGSNLVLACRSCNSSKGAMDVLEWFKKRQKFPPLMIIRRYLKLVAIYCEEHSLLETSLNAKMETLPFDIHKLPIHYPDLTKLRL